MVETLSPMIDVPVANIEQHFSELSRIGNLGPRLEDGFLRAAWSDEESRAMAYVRAAGISRGLKASYDGIGNLYLSTSDKTQGVIQVGSHLDTIPNGGLFDGGAGIVAGLEAILAVGEYWPVLKHKLQLVVWRGEESATFGSVCKGSQAAFGLNDPGILANRFEGQSLGQAILSQGCDPAYIAERRATLSRQQIDAIMAHIELHIEQAKKLQIDQKDVGIVSCIRGAMRSRVVVTGEAAHSGGTPMGPDYRKDANLAMAYMQVELDRLAGHFIEQGEDLVQTVGVINSDPDFNRNNPRVYENATTKVSPFGYFTLDIRSTRAATLSAYTQQAEQVIQRLGEQLCVGVEVSEMNRMPPIESLDARLQDVLEACSDELGISWERMPSGALHDAAVVASQHRSDGSAIPVGMIFIPCRDGISHNPREYASPQEVQKGALVLARALHRLAIDQTGLSP